MCVRPAIVVGGSGCEHREAKDQCRIAGKSNQAGNYTNVVHTLGYNNKLCAIKYDEISVTVCKPVAILPRRIPAANLS